MAYQTTEPETLAPPVDRALSRWQPRSLAAQFMLAGGLVSLAAMIIAGIAVTKIIEDNVTRNSAAATALYVDSVIAPLLPDMRRNEVLSASVTRALDETLGQGALGTKLMSFRLWRRDGTVLYSNDKNMIGRRYTPSEDLRAAFAGRMVANFGLVEDPESAAERATGRPLMEIYNPVLQPWSGEVVAVSEFYEYAPDFQRDLARAQLLSWLGVAGLTLGFFLALSAIVLRGSRTIDSQSRALTTRVRELSEALSQNESLRKRVQRASQRASAINESYFRRVGADLHDGPAQLVALAALRLDSPAVSDPATPAAARERELAAIRSSLHDAMSEIRSICNGLVLPQIEALDLPEILARAVRAHEQRTNVKVEFEAEGAPHPLQTSEKICVYRVVQEALNNGYRHGGGAGQRVMQTFAGGCVVVEVSDGGPGFDPTTVPPSRLGLAGLRERVESLGGRFEVESSGKGTSVRMTLAKQEAEQA
jgi:signal transduction histidine kinase